MAKRRGPPVEPEAKGPVELTEPIDSARNKLEQRVVLGLEMRARQITAVHDFQQLESDHRAWTDYNEELLKRLFTTDELQKDYARRTPGMAMYFEPPTLSQRHRAELEKLEMRLDTLRSTIGRLELYPVVAGLSVSAGAEPVVPKDLTRAFIVHGRDGEAKETVARFLHKLGVTPVILHEQANRGKTIIEKLEHYGNVPFAVVLLTPDDEGRLVGSGEDLRPRARQNVLVELGYFVGLLGREHVCALCKPPIDVPSDFDGVVWVEMDARGAWRMDLARELTAAGFTINPAAIMS